MVKGRAGSASSATPAAASATTVLYAVTLEAENPMTASAGKERRWRVEEEASEKMCLQWRQTDLWSAHSSTPNETSRRGHRRSRRIGFSFLIGGTSASAA